MELGCFEEFHPQSGRGHLEWVIDFPLSLDCYCSEPRILQTIPRFWVNPMTSTKFKNGSFEAVDVVDQLNWNPWVAHDHGKVYIFSCWCCWSTNNHLDPIQFKWDFQTSQTLFWRYFGRSSSIFLFISPFMSFFLLNIKSTSEIVSSFNKYFYGSVRGEICRWGAFSLE